MSVGYRVCLMGASLATGNKGVSALAASLVNLIRQERPEAEIFFCIGERTAKDQKLTLASRVVSVPVVNFRMSPRGLLREQLFWILFLAALQRLVPGDSVRRRIVRSNPCLRAISEADLVGDIRGGDSFSDIYGLWSFVSGCLPDLIALLLGKRLVLLPQTYGPYKSRLAQWLSRVIITRAALVLSRDREGLDVVSGIAGEAYDPTRVSFCPDVAFSLTSMPPSERVVDPPLTGETLIGLNVSGLLYNGGFNRNNMFGLRLDYRAFVHTLAERILRETDAHLLLVPHTYAGAGHVESDQDACGAVLAPLAAAYRGRVHLVTGELDQSEIKGVIGQCEMFIGSRMHACIAAMSQAIPTIGVAYSRKFLGVFESIGVGDMVIDARSTESEDAVRAVISCFQNRNHSGAVLKEKVQKAKELLMTTFHSVLGPSGMR